MKAKTKKTVKKTVKKQAVEVVKEPVKIEKAEEVKEVAPPKPKNYILVIGKAKGMLPLERVIRKAIPEEIPAFLKPHPDIRDSYHPVHSAIKRLPTQTNLLGNLILAITLTDADTATITGDTPVLELHKTTMKMLKNDIAKMLKG